MALLLFLHHVLQCHSWKSATVLNSACTQSCLSALSGHHNMQSKVYCYVKLVFSWGRGSEAGGTAPFPLRLWSDSVLPSSGTPRRGQSHLAPPGASILGSSLRRACPPQPSLLPATSLAQRPKPIWRLSCLLPAGELPLGGYHFLRYYSCCHCHRC